MKIFFSHASKDEEFVTALINTIQLTLELKRENFFYTSGGEIRSGEDWLEKIRVELDRCDLVIAIVTPNFLESSYCHIELGASWIKKLKVIPIMVPPTNKESLNDTPFNFSRTQMSMLQTEDQLRKLYRDIRDELKESGYTIVIEDRSEDVRNKQFIRDKLIPFTNKNIDTNTKSKEALISENAEQQLNLEALLAMNDKLRAENQDLRNIKSPEDLDQYDLDNSDLWEKFELMASKIKVKLDKLAFITPSVIYEEYIHGEPFTDNGNHKGDLKNAVNAGEIDLDEGYYSLNRRHPIVNRTLSDLRDFTEFIAYNSEDLSQNYLTKYGEDQLFEINLKTFWERIFDARIYDSGQ